MLRPLPKAGQELDREKVEEPFHEAADAVLGVAEAAAAVLDFDLAKARNRSMREPSQGAENRQSSPNRCKAPYVFRIGKRCANFSAWRRRASPAHVV